MILVQYTQVIIHMMVLMVLVDCSSFITGIVVVVVEMQDAQNAVAARCVVERATVGAEWWAWRSCWTLKKTCMSV